MKSKKLLPKRYTKRLFRHVKLASERPNAATLTWSFYTSSPSLPYKTNLGGTLKLNGGLSIDFGTLSHSFDITRRVWGPVQSRADLHARRVGYMRRAIEFIAHRSSEVHSLLYFRLLN